MPFYPPDRRVRCTDGTAAATPGAPGGTLRNLSPYMRSGGDISRTRGTYTRGSVGRSETEKGNYRRGTPAISDLTLEQDNVLHGPNDVFDKTDFHDGVQRIYQVEYASGTTASVAAEVMGVGDSYQDEDALLMTVQLDASGGIIEVGF